MPERIDWLKDGTPYSPRFGDRYRSENGGLDQARDVFFKGCGLPAAWAGQPQWRILETGFGLGLNFLVAWHAWRADATRPRLLHFVSTEAFPASSDDILRSAQVHPDLLPLASELAGRLWGLLPGFHRFSFDDGRVLLTLCIGDAKAMLREQSFEADSVFLDGFSPERNPGIWDVHTFKAVARCCRRGTRVATWTVARSVRNALAEAGFATQKVPGIAPKRDNLQGEFNPPWEPKPPRPSARKSPSPRRSATTCLVIGAGLAGSAVASSLARRGWDVTVLDTASAPAAGASGLPAGVLAPHVSPDDSLLSRLSRSGARITLQAARQSLQAGSDWDETGVLEHGVQEPRGLPKDWEDGYAVADADTGAGAAWARKADASALAACDLPPETRALWYPRAGWIKPAALAGAWLAEPGIRWQGDAHVALVRREAGVWLACGADGQVLGRADMVVIAAGYASRELALAPSGRALALQPIRGQVSWAPRKGPCGALPPCPVNGHGFFIPSVPLDGAGPSWIAGASFERDCDEAASRPEDHHENLERLQALLPAAASALQHDWTDGSLRAWTGVRCATPGRLPALGALEGIDDGSAWVCTGMGSRGLTFALLCAEILAARLHAEPLPIEERLASAMRPAYRQP